MVGESSVFFQVDNGLVGNVKKLTIHNNGLTVVLFFGRGVHSEQGMLA